MVSSISGPIPPDPYYDKSDGTMRVTIPAPMKRPEVDHIVMEKHGTSCLALEVEGHRMPSAYKRTKIEHKDHLTENVRRLRGIQRSSRQKTIDETKQPVKALWKLSKFEDVPSKVKQELEKSPSAPRPQSANYLRAHSRTGFLPRSARPSSVEPPDDKLTVPKASTARDVELIRRDIDFVRLNNLAARQPHTVHRSPSLSTLDDMKQRTDEGVKSHKRGQVPNYLAERKKQWEREEHEKIANRPDPDMPAGHRLMPDTERRQTLERIKQKQSELLAELSSMPICNDTLRVRMKREELEQKLAKVEEAIKIFSRQKVFVKLDS